MKETNNEPSSFANRLIPFLAVPLLFLAVSSAWANEPAGTQTLLFLGETRPVVVELELSVGPMPFVESWRQGLAEVVRELDTDGDGSLSRSETDQGPERPQEKESESKAEPAGPAVAEKPRKEPARSVSRLLQTPNLWEADAEPRDGKLSIEELERFLSREGLGPFQAELADETAAVYSPQVTMTGSAGNTLWSWLDEDGNSQLSEQELRGAVDSLQRHDLDSDEAISLREVEGVENPFFSAQRSNQRVETPLFVVLREQPTTPIVRRLIARYVGTNRRSDDKTRVLGVRVETLRIPAADRPTCDRDGNGLLDEFELRAYLKNPVPMVKIRIELPTDEMSEPRLSGEVLAEAADLFVKRSAGTISVLSGEVQLEFDSDGLRPEAVMRSLEERFRICDSDNNGYVEPNEARRDPFFSGQFKTYDADGDEKLYPEEWKPPVSQALKMSSFQTRMTVEDAGKDVFTVLDGDRNLRISPREWLLAADRLAVWDIDDSKTLEMSEVPQVYRISFGPGIPNLPDLLASGNDNARAPKAHQLVKGPDWFRAMDKNGDGDVSAREFLGKPEVFRQIDLDQDTLIDPQEAGKFSPKASGGRKPPGHSQ